MSDELRVQVSGSSNLPSRSREALEKELYIFGNEVLQEAGRLEDETEDISPKIIRQTAEFVRKRNRDPSRMHTKVANLAEATSYISALVGGYFFNNLEQRWGALGAIACVFIGVSAFFVSRRRAGE